MTHLESKPLRTPTSAASEARWLWAIVAGAFVLRIALGTLHPFLFPDSYDYDSLARAIIAGHHYQVHGLQASRLPGYPLLLAAIYFITGASRWAVIFFQAVWGAATVVVAYWVARRLSPRTALAAAAIAALDPLSIAFSAALLSETCFTLALMLAILLVLRLLDQPDRWLDWVLLGLCWTLATYIRGEVVLCLLPLLFWLWWRRPLPSRQLPAGRASSDLPYLLRPLLTLLIVFCGLMPWWLRNYSLFHQDFFRLSTLQGVSLYESVYHGATGGPRQSHIPLPASMQSLNESQRDLAWTHMAWHSIANHPIRIARLALIKIARTWSPWLHAAGYRNLWLNIALSAWSLALFILAACGIFPGRIPLRLLGIPLIVILYFTLMHAVFLGSVRYRVPLLPLLAVLAAVGWTRIWNAPDAAGQ